MLSHKLLAGHVILNRGSGDEVDEESTCFNPSFHQFCLGSNPRVNALRGGGGGGGGVAPGDIFPGTPVFLPLQTPTF